ncbi:glycosyltransferase family 4 protein [Sphingomonas sp. NFX23]|uniref:glycosyltransferase family 4 protein n=1 Tax=Sphingomonas sp. NFX23 TaxID=2819532 RepID=UPI003CE75F99
MAAKEASRLRISFLQPSRAPYRIALLQELMPSYQIKIYYVAGAHDPNRVWETQELTGVESLDPPHWTVVLGGKRFTFSPRAARDASRDADVVVICTNILEFPTYLMAAIFAKLQRIPVLCLVTIGQDYDFFRSGGKLSKYANILLRSLLGLLVKLSDFAICYSKSGVREAKSWGVAGVTSSQYYPLEAEYGPENMLPSLHLRKEHTVELTACIIGYISPRKGITEFLEARRRLNLEDRLNIIIAGPLPAGDAFIQELKNSSWKNVNFIGSVGTAEKAKLFQQVDIMLFPTLHDSWGYVANEAMYAGVPVIASPHSEAAKDLIRHDDNGWVYADDAGLLNAFEQAANPEKLREVSLAARRSAVAFNGQALDAWRFAIAAVAKKGGS